MPVSTRKQFVRQTQPGNLASIALRPIARMRRGKRVPGFPEEQAHYSRAQFDVRFALGSVEVGLANVAGVMEPERKPQASIPGEPIQSPPGERNEPGMQKYTMRPDVT